MVTVRYLVEDVEAAADFYTEHFGFERGLDFSPALVEVTGDGLSLLLSGPQSSAARAMPDGRQPAPGGWNRLLLTVDDIDGHVERLRAAGVTFRNDVIKGPGGRQTVLEDPSGNLVELFEPAG